MIHFWGIVTTCRILNRIESMEFVSLYRGSAGWSYPEDQTRKGFSYPKKAKDRDPVQTCD